ncbi:MAG: dehydrogenase [Polyangiaceae bacterium]|nr:dehydrogenase [Polyangiaceae bacterium]
MPVFRDAAELYRVLDRLLTRVAAEPAIAGPLLAGRFVLRFRYRDPEGAVTIDLREAPMRWELGESALTPDLELIQSGDVAHEFWLGRLNVARAVALRQVVARGPIQKALVLLPAVKPAFPLYREVLRELGRGELATGPVEPAWRQLLSRARARLRGLPTLRALGRRGRRGVDERALNAHYIPLVDAPLESRRTFRARALPTEPDALDLAMLERMLLIRAFEERVGAAWAAGDVPTEAIHLSVGQEGTAVGVCFALRADDYIATTHRGHGHMLAKDADLDGMMAEMLAKASGLCGGKGGSMHVTEAAVGAIGANGIVGASPLMAAGAAHAAVNGKSTQVAVAFLGDGATNQGMFHEALNFAAVLRLPAVFVVENNLYGEFTPQARHMRVTRIADRAAAYGIVGETVDGNDVRAVHAATERAAARARAGEGPTLLECLTYRWHGHMEGEAVPYRSEDEKAAWRARCPILRLAAELEARGVCDRARYEALAAAATARVDAAYARAAAAPEPEPAALTRDVFAPDARALYTPAPLPPATREITYSRALYEALSEELARDERVYLLGEDVTTGGYFAVTVGLVDHHGPARIVDTPISEYAIVGSAVGAALAGARPVAEILFSDFLTTCMDPLVNQAAKLRYMSGGQYAMPLVVRTPGGAGLGMAAQHSQSLEAWLTGIPGLVIVAPATPSDAKGLLKAAIRSDNPVLFFEDKLLYAVTGPVPEGEYLVPIGVADVKRAGRDVTLVSVGAALGKALDAARTLGAEGVEVEVVDVRTLAPLDLATIVRSVQRTGRLVTLEDAPLVHGFGSEIVARVIEVASDALRVPPRRVGALAVPIPYNSKLENLVLPDAERVVEALRSVVRSDRA